jgi:ArsR family transcriptional regulator
MSKNQFTCDCSAIHHQLVACASENMPDFRLLAGVSDFFKILGDPTRCRIIFALLEHEMCVCDLAYLLSMTKSSISHQLSKMRQAGMVKCRREGKEIYYSLDDDHVAQILTITAAHIRHKEAHHEI